ncbi:hypothetical protein AMTR_s00002p00265660 [Amborella trichopoda]|uniref:FBD domain-containing protein n=1 Tax=Amborella trichopoda TaxID=13333 RepID=W1P196_AMBTC|nr:hypothetical protein AMTR_s00002p00265660 [Amborella trichopoda]
MELKLEGFELSQEEASIIVERIPGLKALVLGYGILEKEVLMLILKGHVALERPTASWWWMMRH